jgi:hypothetical protein
LCQGGVRYAKGFKGRGLACIGAAAGVQLPPGIAKTRQGGGKRRRRGRGQRACGVRGLIMGAHGPPEGAPSGMAALTDGKTARRQARAARSHDDAKGEDVDGRRYCRACRRSGEVSRQGAQVTRRCDASMQAAREPGRAGRRASCLRAPTHPSGTSLGRGASQCLGGQWAMPGEGQLRLGPRSGLLRAGPCQKWQRAARQALVFAMRRAHAHAHAHAHTHTHTHTDTHTMYAVHAHTHTTYAVHAHNTCTYAKKTQRRETTCVEQENNEKTSKWARALAQAHTR